MVPKMKNAPCCGQEHHHQDAVDQVCSALTDVHMMVYVDGDGRMAAWDLETALNSEGEEVSLALNLRPQGGTYLTQNMTASIQIEGGGDTISADLEKAGSYKNGTMEESGKLQEDRLGEFGIERAWLDRFAGELSGGELQRFCVARALLSGADYLVCDEISTMLDGITQAQIWETVLKEAKKRNLGIAVITHNFHLAKKLGSRRIDLTAR